MLRPRNEGSGGRDGFVLNMTMSGDGIWDVVYSVQAFIGRSEQPLMLAVDTGSSDIWIADNSCSSSACSSAHTPLYDSSSSVDTSAAFDMKYLRGAVSGSIVWDDIKIGPYAVSSQAMAAADQVTDETLSSNFVGLLGLALPPNSKIITLIPSTETDEPDGATLQQNLFGLTPIDTAPEQRFFSLSLERPGSSRIPSLLGIGRHPVNLVPGFDPSNVAYTRGLVASGQGDTFWRVVIKGINAWVDGAQKPIQLGKSVAVPNNINPVALLDTGGASILTTVEIANGIYGAWNIGPGSDGNYYVPCTTPLNISISLDNLPPIPLHPLDMTSPPPMTRTSSSSSICLGQIQAVPADQLSGYADVILGVPFLRNVYTVLSSSSSPDATTFSTGSIVPRLGLLALTDPSTALAEFHSVRVDGQPLDPSSASGPETSNSSDVAVGKKLSVGLTVLVAIIGFFVACGALFGVRWWILRRRFKRLGQAEQGNAGWAHKKGEKEEPDEDVLREQRWEEGKKTGQFYVEGIVGSQAARTEESSHEGAERDAQQQKDAGEARPKSSLHSRSASSSSASAVTHSRGEREKEIAEETDAWGSELFALHVRTKSEATAVAGFAPLLDEGESSPWSTDGETPSTPLDRPRSSASVSFMDDYGMAGVGVRNSTASNGSTRRPTVRPRGARAPSSGSTSSTGSRTWHAEVGQVLKPIPVDVPWPEEPERGRH